MIVVVSLIVMIRMVVMIIMVSLIFIIRMAVMIRMVIVFFGSDERGQRDHRGRTFINRVKSCQKPLF